VLVATLLATVVACGSPAVEPTTVPTFPETTEKRVASDASAPAYGAVPDNCDVLLTASDLEALLGLPLHSVTVRTTIHVPQPSVGRTERITCVYSGTADPVRGDVLLDLDASAYSDADAATEQWRVNANAQDGDHRRIPIGSASAVLVERRGESVLLVVNEASNLTVLLPDRPLPGNRSRAEALVDLALRVLPALATGGAATPTSEHSREPGAVS
jgi:hypothetical protein